MRKRNGYIGLGVMLVLGAATVLGSDPLYRAIDSQNGGQTYTYLSPQEDQNGFRDQVKMTIEGDTITGLTWDCVKEDGTRKSQLSMEGQYKMTENGLKWHEQAERVADYVLENQSVEGLTGADGYATDAVSAVSINLSGFVNGVNDCLSQAK